MKRKRENSYMRDRTEEPMGRERGKHTMKAGDAAQGRAEQGKREQGITKRGKLEQGKAGWQKGRRHRSGGRWAKMAVRQTGLLPDETGAKDTAEREAAGQVEEGGKAVVGRSLRLAGWGLRKGRETIKNRRERATHEREKHESGYRTEREDQYDKPQTEKTGRASAHQDPPAGSGYKEHTAGRKREARTDMTADEIRAGEKNRTGERETTEEAKRIRETGRKQAEERNGKQTGRSGEAHTENAGRAGRTARRNTDWRKYPSDSRMAQPGERTAGVVEKRSAHRITEQSDVRTFRKRVPVRSYKDSRQGAAYKPGGGSAGQSGSSSFTAGSRSAAAGNTGKRQHVMRRFGKKKLSKTNSVKRNKKKVQALVKTMKHVAELFTKLLTAGGGAAAGVIIVILFCAAAVLSFGNMTGSASQTQALSAEVLAYEPIIRKYANQYGIADYVDLIKAVMMQESAGRGLDPMQASEGGFNTKYPNQPGAITDPEYSIACGVQELKKALDGAEVSSPIDIERIKIALQSYNFGEGYLRFMKRNGYSTWSFQTACEFAESTGWGMRDDPDSAAGPYRYGDQYYPVHVLRYYSFSNGGFGTISIPADGMAIPMYYQSQYQTAYGDGTIATSGCGPTALAMVISYRTGEQVTPEDIVSWAGNRYWDYGANGTSWSIFSAGAAHYGIGSVTQTNSADAVLQALKEGKPVISSQSAGLFTNGGHFIVLRGVTADGRVLVNDPNDSETKNYLGRTFDMQNEVHATSKGYWIFE